MGWNFCGRIEIESEVEIEAPRWACRTVEA